MNWDKALQRFIEEAYDHEQSFTEKDREILSCLIVLHEAVQKKNDLRKVSQLLIDHSGFKPSPIILINPRR